MSKILNLGCGEETYGDVRVDFVKTKTTTHVCDLNKKLPFRNGEFSEVYCKSVLEHIGNVKQFVEECMRVLKKGGKFWFRTDSSIYIGFLFRNHQDYIKYNYTSKDDKHYYLFKKEHLINLFEGYDLDITYTCPNKRYLFWLPYKFKCCHIEASGIK